MVLCFDFVAQSGSIRSVVVMAPKKSAAKRSASGKSAKASEATGSADVRWSRKQIAALAQQHEACAERGDTWVEESHTWHQGKLEKLLELLESGKLETVPEDVRESVDMYVEQLADGNEVTQDAFYDGRDIYDAVLQESSAGGTSAPYERPPETTETEAAIAEITGWTNTSMQGMDKFTKLLKLQETSAGVQEAGLTRIGALVSEAGKASASSATQGVAPKAILALIADCMRRCPRDPEVQKRGCVAIRQLFVVEGNASTVLQAGGAKLVVEALRAHIADPGVAAYGTRALADMTQKSAKHSPEWAKLRESGAEGILTEIIPYHLTDPRIDKAARTAIPFLRS